MSKRRIGKTAGLVEVNRNIHELARGSSAEKTVWQFFCECGRGDCHEYVFMTLDGYVALHDQGKPVLAGGHHLSQVERARRLRSSAEALKRQAEHQVKRARKNLRPGED